MMGANTDGEVTKETRAGGAPGMRRAVNRPLQSTIFRNKEKRVEAISRLERWNHRTQKMIALSDLCHLLLIPETFVRELLMVETAPIGTITLPIADYSHFKAFKGKGALHRRWYPLTLVQWIGELDRLDAIRRGEFDLNDNAQLHAANLMMHGKVERNDL